MAVHCCPHCGAGLDSLERVDVGNLTIDYGGAVIAWKGKALALTPCERLLVITVAGAAGAFVRNYVLADALGYAGDKPSELINVTTCHVRKKFQAFDPTFDRIESGLGGRRWRMEGEGQC